MATPVEHIAIWILEALEAEAIIQPDITLRRGDAIVFGAVMAAHKLDSLDIDRGRRFLAEISYISATAGGDGETTFTLPAGSQYLAAHRDKQAQGVLKSREKNDWTLDRRIAMMALIWTVVIAGVGLLVQWLMR